MALRKIRIGNCVDILQYDDSEYPTDFSDVEIGADVTGDHEAATIVDQGILATRDFVDLATADVINKNLDNIDDTVTYTRIPTTFIEEGKIAVIGLHSNITDRMFNDSNIRLTVEGWRHVLDLTLIDGGYIYTKTITADKFVSTLFGDLNQAMDYVKTVLGAGDEYAHAIVIADMAAGTASYTDVLSHVDYDPSIRIVTVIEWDDVGAVWDSDNWDIPTNAAGSWTSASNDIGASKTLQIALMYTMIEDDPSKTYPTIKAIYSSDDINWGSNAALNDNIWETLSERNITGDIYRSTGTLKTFRYFKIKIELNTIDTTCRIILHTMSYLGNVVNLFGMVVSQTIASGGTAVTLVGFNLTPAVTVTPVGATPLVPLITAQSVNSVTIKLYNLAGADVGGVCNLTIIGV